MNYLSQLSEDEVRYVCSVIPPKDTIAYFQHNPKEFAKICPGFRASAITRLDIGNLLFRYRNWDFVSSYIEKHIDNWLPQIQEHVDKCMADGDSKNLAYIHTLPFCYFAGNIALYFKLIKQECFDEYINMLAAAVIAIKEASEKQENLQAALKSKESDIIQLHLDLKSTMSELEESKAKLNKHLLEIRALNHTIANLEKLKITVQNSEETIISLKFEAQMQEKTVQELRTELAAAKDIQQQLETQIRATLERKHAEKVAKQEVTQKPMQPKDIDEFIDFLGYNLENIGLPSRAEYYALLKHHLSCILFQGMPILINRRMGMTLMKCIANALIGTSIIRTLTFKNNITEQAIDEFLSSDARIVCLDNFIGNFNETELLPLFDKHKNKIIFLSVAYDRTLCFVPDDFLKYCHYLNLNRIAALSTYTETTEDPSTIEEVVAVSQGIRPDTRYSPLLRKILEELGFRQSLIEYKCAFISREQDLCRVLAFDILPFCVDVLQIAPYNTSERLIKYAGSSGRCSYKDLFIGWFGQ